MTENKFSIYERPIIILDSSFILNGILKNESLDNKEFLNRCILYRRLRRKRVKIPVAIQEELKKKLTPYRDDPNVSAGIRKLFHYPSTLPENQLFNNPMLKFLYQKISQTGERLSSKFSIKNLSEVDKIYCTTAIDSTRYGNVVAATLDFLITSTLQRVHEITHPVFSRHGYLDTSLSFIKNNNELRSIIEDYSTALREKSSEDLVLVKN